MFDVILIDLRIINGKDIIIPKAIQSAFKIVFYSKRPNERAIQYLLALIFQTPLRHFGDKPTRGSGIDREPIFRPFHCKVFGKGNDGPFASIISNDIHIFGI